MIDVVAYYHEPRKTPFLRAAVLPAVAGLRSAGWAAHVERHWLHGPHVRVRIAPGTAAGDVTAAAHEVAAAYLDTPARRDPVVAAAYAQLATESDRLFARITSPDRPGRVRVAFTTCPTPYADEWELVRSVREDRLLEVVTVAAQPDQRHPLMGSEAGGAHDRFRAVHDVLGHARWRLGFDRDGEFTAWRLQDRLHGPLARRALATELHGQHSVRWTTGAPVAPRPVLLDPRLVRRSVTASQRTPERRTPQRPGPRTPGPPDQRKDHHETRHHRR
jgi:hypothetical protein